MKKRLMLTVSLAALAVNCRAFAQESPAPAEGVISLEEVVVTGVRKSLRDALAIKEDQTGVVEVLSSQDIGALPNVTIAETLKHLPGINTTRDRGNDSQAAIGGLGPRMVLGLLNGREIATSEPDRNVRWEIFPSEIVSGVQLYKTSRADLISGGVSGTIDIQTIRPLDYNGPQLVASAGPVFYDGGSHLPDYRTLGYRGSAAYIPRLTSDLALVVAATYQDQRNGYEGLGGGGWNNYASGSNQGTINGVKVDTPWGAGLNATNLNQRRSSISSTLQWRPSDSFEGSFDILHTKVQDDEQGDTGWWNGWGNWAGNGTQYLNPVIQDGALVAATVKEQPYQGADFNQVISLYHQTMLLFATGLNGKFHAGAWTIVGDVAFSEAERYGEWQAAEMEYDPGDVTFDYRGAHPSITQTISGPQAYANGNLLAVNGESQTNHVKDKLVSASGDFTRDFSGDFWRKLKFGARVSARDKQDAEPGAPGTTVYVTPITPSSTNPQSSWLNIVPAGLPLGTWTYKSMTIPTLFSGNFATIADSLYGPTQAATLWQNQQATPFESNVRENDREAYVQALFDTKAFGVPANGDFGLRVVNVRSDSRGPVNVNGTNVILSEGNSYTYPLPSFNERFKIADGTFIKVGLARALSRPPLNDLRIDRSYNTNLATGPLSGNGGTPRLKPYTSDQLNVAYENYFRKDGLFALNLFYKRLRNYIGFDTETIVPVGVTLPAGYTTLPFTAPYNQTKPGNLEGAEFTFQTPFYFIPHMERFGIYSNLALVSSKMKENYPSTNPFPINGLAKTTATVDLYYSTPAWDARLGMKYHSPFTVLYTWNSAGLSAVKSEFTMDFSTSYNINDSLGVKFQASNLLNTPLRTYDNNNPGELDRIDYYGRTYLLALNVKVK